MISSNVSSGSHRRCSSAWNRQAKSPCANSMPMIKRKIRECEIRLRVGIPPKTITKGQSTWTQSLTTLTMTLTIKIGGKSLKSLSKSLLSRSSYPKKNPAQLRNRKPQWLRALMKFLRMSHQIQHFTAINLISSLNRLRSAPHVSFANSNTS